MACSEGVLSAGDAGEKGTHRRSGGQKAPAACTMNPHPTPIEPAARPAWQTLDRVYCISVAERLDRRRHAESQFERIGLGGRVEFVIVQKHPTDSERGIFESHQRCLRAGIAAGAKRIAIFEDDVVFDRFSPRRLGHAARFMETSADWDLFLFGCFVTKIEKTPFPAVEKVRYHATTHGYVVHDVFARRLAELPWCGVPYDVALRSVVAGRAFAVAPTFAFQDDSPTDNNKIIEMDRFRRRLGGTRRLQKLTEFWFRHPAAIIAGHVVVIGGLIGLVRWLWF